MRTVPFNGNKMCTTNNDLKLPWDEPQDEFGKSSFNKHGNITIQRSDPALDNPNSGEECEENRYHNEVQTYNENYLKHNFHIALKSTTVCSWELG